MVSICKEKGCDICKLHTYINFSWDFLQDEVHKEYFKQILKTLHSTPVFYPPVNQIFSFTHFTKFEDIKVVIIGQDPYHNPGQAMGLSFSVQKTEKIPRSLVNIYKELANDVSGFVAPEHGDLSGWAKQGVLLLNDTLTVEKNKAASHAKIGWQNFTRKIIEKINADLKNVVFILWGNYAKKKSVMIDKKKHLVLESVIQVR